MNHRPRQSQSNFSVHLAMATFGKTLVIIIVTLVTIAICFDHVERKRSLNNNQPDQSHLDQVNVEDIFPIRKLFVPIQKRTNDRPGDLFILAALFEENDIETRAADMNGVRVESATKGGAHIIAAPNSKYTGSFNVTFANENDI